MNCSSSRSGTNVSCLRSSRRKMLLSFSTTPRAESGSKRISAETVFRVLNRKCGLIWLESASIRAFSNSCWCRSRFISTRVLFQIFSGAATDIRVAITTSTSHQSRFSQQAHRRFGDVEERERPEVPKIFFVGNRLPDQTSEQSRCGCRGHRQPLMRDQRRNRDDRAADRPHNAPSEQPHQKGALQGQIGERVRGPSHEPQGHAHEQRRRQEHRQFEFLVGIALLGEEHASKSCPPRQQRGNGRRHPHLQQQGEQQVPNTCYCFHFWSRVSG